VTDPTWRRLAGGTFALTIFVSASLLFVVQPMVGKMILPHLGGSSSVWTTCMLFFQLMLVVGYVYAHLLAQQLEPERQVLLHLGLVLAAIATSLPFALSDQLLSARSAPALWLLVALLASVGLPLFVVSSSAPLFQHWFSATDHPDADDPYYLYAASNVGSMIALFGYPFAVERTFDLDTQSRLWAWGFGGLAALTVGCGALVWRSETDAETTEAAEAVGGVDWSRRGWWVLITFIPSSLMLGVTDYLTTDIASVPLLWVFPLGIYLFSFILVFSRLPLNLSLYRGAIPVVTLLTLAGTFSGFLSMIGIVGAQLWMFYIQTVYFHGLLAEDRPPPEHLTEYYIWMSVGGAAGGLFNALLAPMLFDWTIEYYLILALGVALIPPLYGGDEGEGSKLLGWGMGVALAASVGTYLWSVYPIMEFDQVSSALGGLVLVAVIVGMGMVFPRGRNVGLALILLLGFGIYEGVSVDSHYERSFYASYSIYDDRIAGEEVRVFSHGTTQHGLQVVEGPLREQAAGYHHPAGPIGDVFAAYRPERVAVAGLGAGALAAYADPGDQFVFYEIDPVVEDIAREHFTYLEQCGEFCEVKIGDARKLLERAEPDTFEVIVMDAYNSDSVPTHLLTREAMKLYLSKLKEDGVVVMHVSNRYLDIEGVVGALVEDLGLASCTRSYSPTTDRNDESLAYASTYTIVARDSSDLDPLREQGQCSETNDAGVVWTDRFSNVASVFEWE
jgi:SAM-dependent methyltransferase